MAYYDHYFGKNEIFWFNGDCFSSFKRKYFNGNYYLEVNDKRYKTNPIENIILAQREPTESLRSQYQFQNETDVRKNQKLIRNDNDQLIVKNFPE